jgi:ArsR family transcriptional regulator
MERALDLVACCRPLDEGSLADDEAAAAALMFKALADPARVRLVNLLATSDEPVCACELIPSMSLAQPTVSHHLKKLTEAGLLEREQRGKWAYFTLNREALRRLAAIIQLEEVLE